MDLTNIKISEIKNLNLIYLYSTDSIFTKDEKKYLGIRVVYNNNKDYMSLDFKDSHFSSLVKHIIKRYNQEKDSRNIILLGALTQKLMSDEELIKISEERQSFSSNGLTLFDTNKEKIKVFEPYIKEVIKDLLKSLKQYDVVSVDKIDGYNNRYIIEYSIGNVKKELHVILSLSEKDTLLFKIRIFDGINLLIEGQIKNELNNVFVDYKTEDNSVSGNYIYDAIDNNVLKKVVSGNNTIYYSEDADTIVDEDRKLVDFYLNLFSISWDNEFLKTADNNYIFGCSENLLEEQDNILKENHGMQLYITDDVVKLKYKIKNGISKFNNYLNVELDYTLYEITLSKLEINGKMYALIEKVTSNEFGKKYDYTIHEIDDVSFKNPFSIKDTNTLSDIKSLYDVKNMVLKRTGGNE